MPSDSEPAGRATRLPPGERRAAIIAATIPLVRTHGYAVTTRQIADASGVGEGTLFRVFDDKNHLIREAICQALESAGVDDQIATIDRTLPLRTRLIQATALVQQRMQDVFELFAAVRLGPPPGEEKVLDRPPPAHQRTDEEIVVLIEPDGEAFRLPPAEVARFLRVLTFAGSHANLNEGGSMTPEEIVSVLLDGVVQPSARV